MASLGLAGPLARPAAAQAPLPCSTTLSGCNVLTNPSFEQTLNGACPQSISTVGLRMPVGTNTGPIGQDQMKPTPRPSLACDWFSGNAVGTPDLFNACAPGPGPVGSLSYSVGVPCNFATACTAAGQPGTDQPALTGQSYAGLIGFVPQSSARPNDADDYREYLAHQLSPALTANTAYYVGFRANIAPASGLAIPMLGLAFTSLPALAPPGRVAYAGSGRIPLAAAASGPVAAVPVPDWNRIQGIYTATGTETQVLVGNFGPGYGPAPAYAAPAYGPGPGAGITNPPFPETATMAYYFIEDVVIQPVPTAGADRTARCGDYVTLGSGCALPASSGATYQWQPTTGLYNPTTPSPTLVVGPNTPAQYTLTVTLPGGQTSVSTVRVTVASPPLTVVPNAKGPYCVGSVVTLTASGGSGQQYTWGPAAGLSATSGAVVTVALPATPGIVRYTVSGPCSAPYTVVLETTADCCALKAIADSKYLVKLGQGQYSTSPFGQQVVPTGVVPTYYFPVSTVLTNDAFRPGPGSRILLEANCSLILRDGASLDLSGVTLTAACDEMWGGVYVDGSAAGLLTGFGNNRKPAVVEHSRHGLVFQGGNPGAPPPYFKLADTYFRHNETSVEINRIYTPSTPDDYLARCSFDSDPRAFLSPRRADPQRPRNDYYSESHVLLRGDVRPSVVGGNRFDHAMVGVLVPNYYGWATLQDNAFDNCYFAGVSMGDFAQGSFSAPSQDPEMTLTGNVFTLPEAQPATDQRRNNIPVGYLNTQECFGAALVFVKVDATGNVFRQRDLTRRYKDYDFDQVREKQTGLYTQYLRTANDNTFFTLHTGLYANLSENRTAEVRGNSFVDCQRGAEVTTRPDNGGAAPVLYSTCNTFQRGDKRGGTACGYFLSEAPNQAGYYPPLVFDDPTRLGQGVVLKDLFDPSGRRPGDYWAIWNQTSNVVNYLTFDEQAHGSRSNDYPTYSSGRGGPTTVNVTGTTSGPIDATGLGNDPNLYVCQFVGFPDTGIRRRGIATGVQPVDEALVQNAPNPCSGTTRFEVHLPVKASAATLLIRRGLDGREVARLSLKPTASHSDVDVRGYVPGTYFCTLVVDGLPVQTKRMVVE